MIKKYSLRIKPPSAASARYILIYYVLKGRKDASTIIRDSNRFDLLCKSILIDSFSKKSAFLFISCHAVFLAYLLYSLSQKNKLTSLFAAIIL